MLHNRSALAEWINFLYGLCHSPKAGYNPTTFLGLCGHKNGLGFLARTMTMNVSFDKRKQNIGERRGRSWNEHILRCGEFVVLVNDALNQQHLVNKFHMKHFTKNIVSGRKGWTKLLNADASAETLLPT